MTRGAWTSSSSGFEPQIRVSELVTSNILANAIDAGSHPPQTDSSTTKARGSRAREATSADAGECLCIVSLLTPHSGQSSGCANTEPRRACFIFSRVRLEDAWSGDTHADEGDVDIKKTCRSWTDTAMMFCLKKLPGTAKTSIGRAAETVNDEVVEDKGSKPPELGEYPSSAESDSQCHRMISSTKPYVVKSQFAGDSNVVHKIVRSIRSFDSRISFRKCSDSLTAVSKKIVF